MKSTSIIVATLFSALALPVFAQTGAPAAPATPSAAAAPATTTAPKAEPTVKHKAAKHAAKAKAKMKATKEKAADAVKPASETAPAKTK